MTTWRNAIEDRADCEACDFEAFGPPSRVLRAARVHKYEQPDHVVIIWRESWREIEKGVR